MARDHIMCSCGAPAIVVFETQDFGPVGWCGVSTAEADHQDEVLGKRAERSEVRWAVEDSRAE